MPSDWTTAATCASAIAAIIALALSYNQIRLSNRQNLFARRLDIWIKTQKMLDLYKKNECHIEQPNEPILDIDLLFVWLTNTSFLQEISPAISHTLEQRYQLMLHLKLDEIRSLALEAKCSFKGSSATLISNFLVAYQSLLFSIYQYQILLNKMEETSRNFHQTKEEAASTVNEQNYRSKLFAAENKLRKDYQMLCKHTAAGKIERQIRLTSTFRDYVNTFRP